MRDEPVVDGEVCILDHEFKIVVRLVEFVPEEQIGLGRNLGVRHNRRSVANNRPEKIENPST